MLSRNNFKQIALNSNGGQLIGKIIMLTLQWNYHITTTEYILVNMNLLWMFVFGVSILHNLYFLHVIIWNKKLKSISNMLVFIYFVCYILPTIFYIQFFFYPQPEEVSNGFHDELILNSIIHILCCFFMTIKTLCYMEIEKKEHNNVPLIV
jgi:hypothetical protein